MTDITDSNVSMTSDPAIISAESNHEDVQKLLESLQQSAPIAVESRQLTKNARQENELAVAKLGIAASLFNALRTRHSSTAAHSLRVALCCSAWADHLGLDRETRDRIEVAALLHDVGKIGIPDRILRKPSRLNVEEQLTVDRCPELSCQILRGCTNDNDLLSTVLHCNTWYDTRRHQDGLRGDALPLGSRMLLIAGAYDSMTSEHVFRSAMSHEVAIEQLERGSGTQFDPDLVSDFKRMLTDRPDAARGSVVDRWLNDFQGSGDRVWAMSTGAVASPSKPRSNPDSSRKHVTRVESRFHTRLLTDLKDGVAFTDSEGTITHWNATMVRLTGIASDAIVGKHWSTKALNLYPQKQSDGGGCPLQDCFDRSAPISREMEIRRKGADPTPVHIQVSPVSSEQDFCRVGAVIILHDNSVRSELEEQLQTLHEKSTLDGLTGVANRAHLDKTARDFTEAASNGGATFSLVICDIDHFKQVNDVHGHPAGDEALVSFAQVLREHSREGDLVARYGGEEFVLLAHNCDNETAAKRAEAIRRSLENTPLPSLGNRSVTASFGVTEFQAGDSAETVLSRADRALLKAKDSGRNRVTQLGCGTKGTDAKPAAQTESSGWFGWFDSSNERVETEIDIVTPVHANMAIEKLKGFIADHDAEIISVNESQVSLKINALCPTGGRRRADQRISMTVQLTLSEARPDELGALRHGGAFTKVHSILAPLRSRDRRKREYQGCVDQLICSLKSYLMGEILPPTDA